MNKTTAIYPGEIVQINPAAADVRAEFRGALLVVTEAKSWGVVGYVATLNMAVGLYYTRVEWKDVEWTEGKVTWSLEPKGDNDGDSEQTKDEAKDQGQSQGDSDP